MVTNLPESEIPDVREYIYVDTNRVRSLLAQMSEGLPDEKATSASRSSRLRLGTKLAGFESGRDGTQSERLALADLHVSMMEEAATSLGLSSRPPSVSVRRSSGCAGRSVRNLSRACCSGSPLPRS